VNIYLLTREGRGRLPSYDEAVGFVVAAGWPRQARRLACERAGDEGGITWLDPQRSICKLIASDANYTTPAVVMRDYMAG
jgi:hypothetical protein